MNKHITIKGHQSDWYEEARFTLKTEHLQSPPKNLADFAEQLVETHMKKSTANFSSDPQWINIFFTLSLIFLGFMVLFYYFTF